MVAPWVTFPAGSIRDRIPRAKCRHGIAMSDESIYRAKRLDYENIALDKAFHAIGIGPMRATWPGVTPTDLNSPFVGAFTMRDVAQGIYNYYGALHDRRPGSFLWSGLACVAGTLFMAQLEVMTDASGSLLGWQDNRFMAWLTGSPDISDLFVRMVSTQRTIFMDLAWQHEAALAGEDMVVLGSLHDRFDQTVRFTVPTTPGSSRVRKSYREAWNQIQSGSISRGNLDLLENEQYDIVQPLYNWIKRQGSNNLASLNARQAHPYHYSFWPPNNGFVPASVIARHASESILDFGPRWAWFTEPDGLTDMWDRIGAAERSRLIALPSIERKEQRWGPIPSQWIKSVRRER